MSPGKSRGTWYLYHRLKPCTIQANGGILVEKGSWGGSIILKFWRLWFVPREGWPLTDFSAMKKFVGEGWRLIIMLTSQILCICHVSEVVWSIIFVTTEVLEITIDEIACVALMTLYVRWKISSFSNWCTPCFLPPSFLSKHHHSMAKSSLWCIPHIILRHHPIRRQLLISQPTMRGTLTLPHTRGELCYVPTAHASIRGCASNKVVVSS